jgi:hypothetical protein
MDRTYIKYAASFFLLAIAGLVTSCDYIKTPYPKNQGPSVGPGSGYVKKVLIEDYTAQQCIYCPQAAIIGEHLRSNNPGRIVTIGVHVSSLAQPGPAPFTYDFRTTAGTNYDATFGISASGLPSGMVDRIQYQGSFPVDRNNWQAAAAAELALPCTAYLTITNLYDPLTRVLNTSVKTRFLAPLTSTYNLVVLLTEDSIVKPQKDIDSSQYPNSIVMNYVHHFALRAAVNGASGVGEQLSLPHNPTISGDSLVKNYSYTVPASFPATGQTIPCNDKHCYIVAFLYDVSTSTVLQVEEQKLR